MRTLLRLTDYHFELLPKYILHINYRVIKIDIKNHKITCLK